LYSIMYFGGKRELSVRTIKKINPKTVRFAQGYGSINKDSIDSEWFTSKLGAFEDILKRNERVLERNFRELKPLEREIHILKKIVKRLKGVGKS